MSHSPEMLSYTARLVSFEQPQQLSKRRASSQSTRKRNGSTVEWPHTQPSVEDLARAGFFYKPSQQSPDNVQCFMCGVKLDGWEKDDEPASEHLAHSRVCAWAIAMSVAPRVGYEEIRDPMSEEMIAARTTTFNMGEGWVHEKKKGWKCKTKKMVEAGWCFEPAQDVEDAVTCFYCGLGLDGWEPKDDPLEEHRKRQPDCAFFALTANFGSAAGTKTKAKGKGRSKAAGRGSAASTASSRISTQSAMSTFSDPPSLADIGDDLPAADDSILNTATSTSTATAKGGKKKATRAKAPAKSKKTKKGSTVSEQEDADVQYPDLSQALQADSMEVDAAPEPPAPKPARKGRAAARASQQIDSSIVEISAMSTAPKKTGRKAKAQPVKTPEPEDYDMRNSEASAQLLDELELSLAEPEHEATPQATQPQRGTKRTSDGLPKDQDSGESPIAPSKQKTAKGAGVETTAPSHPEDAPDALLFSPNTSITEYPWATGQFPASESEMDQPKKGAKGKKATASKTKGKKVSSARSSKATVVFAIPEPVQTEEDLARDEEEIEAELERIATEAKAAEEAVLTKAGPDEQGNADEYEPSPTHSNRRPQDLEAEIVTVKSVSPPPNDAAALDKVTPSPAGSDKENNPSVLQLSAKPTTNIYTSPTKTTRIPLAPTTPNVSPRKAAATSPSKQLSRLTSTAPWTSADLETILLASPQPSPRTLDQRLADVAGSLTSPEKGMTVEGWVRHLAAKEEEVLRMKCEQMVTVVEREGMRAMQTLEGITSS